MSFSTSIQFCRPVPQVHATVQKFLVTCKDDEHKICEIKKRLQYNKDGVNLIVTKTPHK